MGHVLLNTCYTVLGSVVEKETTSDESRCIKDGDLGSSSWPPRHKTLIIDMFPKNSEMLVSQMHAHVAQVGLWSLSGLCLVLLRGNVYDAEMDVKVQNKSVSSKATTTTTGVLPNTFRLQIDVHRKEFSTEHSGRLRDAGSLDVM